MMKDRKVIVLAVLDDVGGHYNNDEINEGASALRYKYHGRQVGAGEAAYKQDVLISEIHMVRDDSQHRKNEPGERHLEMSEDSKAALREFCQGANDCGVYIIAHGNSRGYIGSMFGSVTGTMLGSFVKALPLPRVTYICVISCHAAAASVDGPVESIVIDICDTFSQVVNGDPPQISGYEVGVFLHGVREDDKNLIGRKYVGIGGRGGRIKDSKEIRGYQLPAELPKGDNAKQRHLDMISAKESFKKVYTYAGNQWVNTFQAGQKRRQN